MPKTIALVSCVGRKAPTPMPARDLYTSDWFRKASTYAQRVSDQWYILSAEHALLHPDTVINPYERTLNTMPVAERREWAVRVMDSLRRILEPGDELIFLAGVRYRENIVEPIRDLSCQVAIPMEGLTIGRQLAWLKQARESNHAPDRL